jgi:lipopolysaccharide transport system permease protein
LNNQSTESKQGVIDGDKWDLVIRPRAGFFELHLGEVWRYRDLIMLFVRRDFVAQYTQTVLGPLWHLIQPVLTTIMFLVIFGRIARIPTDGIEPVLFYMSGITLWSYFSVTLTSTASTFVTNASIFGKVYFPRIIIPLSVVMSNLIRFVIQLSLLMAVMIWYHFHGCPLHLSLYWLAIPGVLGIMAGIVLGLGVIISSMTTKYRDLTVLLAFAVQLGMYATPIVYPMSYLRDSPYRSLIQLNPLTPLLEAFRFCLFGKGTFTVEDIAFSFVFMVVTMAGGILVFNRVERTFMDTV